MTKRFFSFNTGRHYTQAGQPLFCSAEETPEGRLQLGFFDTARSIPGLATITVARPLSEYTDRELQAEVMYAYDYNEYEQLWSARPELQAIKEHFDLGLK